MRLNCVERRHSATVEDIEKGIAQLMPNSYLTPRDFAVGISLQSYGALAPSRRSNHDP
jgi:hypothetical protein